MIFKSVLMFSSLLYLCACSSGLSVRSKAFTSNLKSDYVFNGNDCDGENISPDVSWSKPPEGTKSLAITIYDPDAPNSAGWWHWIVYNIPADVDKIDKNASATGLPNGAKQAINDFGKEAYGGPCPPSQDKPHRYILTVYALKVGRLNISPYSTSSMIGAMIENNSIAKDQIMIKYGR